MEGLRESQIPIGYVAMQIMVIKLNKNNKVIKKGY